jgi:DNA-binding CsgD family transcriptional regulator
MTELILRVAPYVGHIECPDISMAKGRSLAFANSVRSERAVTFNPDSTFERWLGSLDARPRLVIDRELKIIWQSDKAAELVQQPVPLNLNKGYLGADTDATLNELAEFVERVGEECVTLLVQSSEKKHWAMVMALSPQEDPSLVCLMLNLSVPHRSVEQSGLAKALCLTVCEARVLDQFSRLNSTREIAHNLGVSLSTVRSHMKQIHSKAGVGSAVQLTQLVRGYCSC